MLATEGPQGAGLDQETLNQESTAHGVDPNREKERQTTSSASRKKKYRCNLARERTRKPSRDSCIAHRKIKRRMGVAEESLRFSVVGSRRFLPKQKHETPRTPIRESANVRKVRKA